MRSGNCRCLWQAPVEGADGGQTGTGTCFCETRASPRPTASAVTAGRCGPSYGTEYVGQNDAAKINDFEDRALHEIVVDDVEDLEIALSIDLDGDGSITPESDMTQVVQQIAIRRQKPGMRDTQFKFTNSTDP